LANVLKNLKEFHGETNSLQMPQEAFGNYGIYVGNIICNALKKFESECGRPKYDPASRQVVVVNSSSISPQVFRDALYQAEYTPMYKVCQIYPLVLREKTSEGNIKIKLMGHQLFEPGHYLDDPLACLFKDHVSYLPDPELADSTRALRKMNLSVDELKIPQEHFGRHGVIVGNFVRQLLKQHSPKLDTVYDESTRQITVHNTSNMQPLELRRILNEGVSVYETFRRYVGVNGTRDANGNLQICFLSDKGALTN
jgi:hypothetical protein